MAGLQTLRVFDRRGYTGKEEGKPLAFGSLHPTFGGRGKLGVCLATVGRRGLAEDFVGGGAAVVEEGATDGEAGGGCGKPAAVS